MKVYQSEVSNNSPSSTPLSGGFGMDSSVECIPGKIFVTFNLFCLFFETIYFYIMYIGPNWSCLGNNTDQAQVLAFTFFSLHILVSFIFI